MTAVWPGAIVIQQMLPLSAVPLEQRHVFQPEQGAPMIAPASTVSLWMASFDVLLTGANVRDDFLNWWEVSLKNGSEAFTGIEDVVDDGGATYRFREMPTFTLLRGSTTPAARLWRSSFSLWQIA
jgi:hypothetical protein